MKIFEIPEKLTVEWNNEAKAIIDTWTSYSVSLEDFNTGIKKGINHLVANGGTAWIIDSRKSKGQFSKEIQDFIVTDILPNLSKNGVKYFMTIDSFDDITKTTVDHYIKKASEVGVKVIKGSSVKGAINWLVRNVRQT